MERTSGIVCNSLRALLRHFIQRLVKRDLLCFAFCRAKVLAGVNLLARFSNGGPSRWRRGGVVERREKALTPSRWESAWWRLPVYRFKCGLENSEN